MVQYHNYCQLVTRWMLVLLRLILLALMLMRLLLRGLRLMRLILLALMLMRLLLLMRLILLMLMRLRLARSVVVLAARSALSACAQSTATTRHARHTGKAYLIPRLIKWCQLVSLMPLYPSFPCTPYPGRVSWPCFLVTSLGHVSCFGHDSCPIC